jgi:MHS family shikimate/dehydroshikimate transporter-like MFS transporter
MTAGGATSRGAFGDEAARRALVGSFFGTALETYDFVLFGTAAAFVFGKLFFPNSDPVAGTLFAFGAFAVGFIARPLGGILIGNYGDRLGRKPMLLLTLGVMGVVTAMIGLLPTYAQIGITAPILLTVLRFIQGIAYGGEWGGAILVVVEHAPISRRGFFGGFANGGTPLGAVLAAGVLSLCVYATGDQFLSWGWRIPFLLSIAMIGMGLYVRTRILETPEFLALKREGRMSKRPILDAVRRYYREILLTAGIVVMSTGTYYITSIFMLSYGTATLGMSVHTMLRALIVQNVAAIIASIGFGALSDRIGRVYLMKAGAALMALYIFPMFWLVQTADPVLMTLGLALSGFGIGVIHGPAAAYYTELYDASVRYSGTTLGMQIGIVFGGGFSPLIAAALLRHFDGATWPICLYVMALAVAALVCVTGLGEIYRKPDYAAAD